MIENNDAQNEGQRSFEEYKAQILSDPKLRAMYEKEFRKKELWLQLVEARQEAGLTQKEVAERLGVSQAQVARIEKAGYGNYTLRTLERYIEALGDQFTVSVKIEKKSA